MFILGDEWRDGYLDYHRSEGELRIAVRAWWPVEELRDVFIPQPRSLRRVWNYLRELGIRATVRKIRSRLAERIRDQRVVALGVGEVVESDAQSSHSPGDAVVFVAPCHPRCVERLVLPTECVRSVHASLLGRFPRGNVYLFDQLRPGLKIPPELCGWSPLSGRAFPPAAVSLLREAENCFASASIEQARRLPAPGTQVSERGGSLPRKDGRRSAVVFGLGNYAKTCIIPNLGSSLQLQCVHEIDPTQIGSVTGAQIIYDTNPNLRSDEAYDVYFVAGYHHTHADLAIQALDRGGRVVVEKPLVTTREQLASLLAAMRRHPGRLYAGYYMRYNPLYAHVREDLNLRPGEPVHYHCIIYEISLLKNHWYNWPVSRSRVLSNGAHWIDHFLFLNNFSRPVRSHLWRGSNNDLHVSLELENGAVFGMALTDIGSRRTGVQQHVELRAGQVTIITENDTRYLAQDDLRVIRRKQIRKSELNPAKYRAIISKICNDEPGETAEYVEMSCELMLQLDEQASAGADGDNVQEAEPDAALDRVAM